MQDDDTTTEDSSTCNPSAKAASSCTSSSTSAEQPKGSSGGKTGDREEPKRAMAQLLGLPSAFCSAVLARFGWNRQKAVDFVVTASTEEVKFCCIRTHQLECIIGVNHDLLKLAIMAQISSFVSKDDVSPLPDSSAKQTRFHITARSENAVSALLATANDSLAATKLSANIHLTTRARAGPATRNPRRKHPCGWCGPRASARPSLNYNLLAMYTGPLHSRECNSKIRRVVIDHQHNQLTHFAREELEPLLVPLGQVCYMPTPKHFQSLGASCPSAIALPASTHNALCVPSPPKQQQLLFVPVSPKAKPTRKLPLASSDDHERDRIARNKIHSRNANVYSHLRCPHCGVDFHFLCRERWYRERGCVHVKLQAMLYMPLIGIISQNIVTRPGTNRESVRERDPSNERCVISADNLSNSY